MMGERWARALYSYYNWRTVRGLPLLTLLCDTHASEQIRASVSLHDESTLP